MKAKAWKLTSEQQQLVEKNIGLAFKRAGYWWRSRKIKDFDTALSLACEAVCGAASKFDPSRGFRFATLAYTFIDNNMKRYLVYERRDKSRILNESTTLVYEPGVVQDFDPDETRYFFELLNDQEKEVAFWRQRGETLKQVGDRMDLTKERIRQIQTQAINKIKAAIEGERLAA